MKVQTGFVSNSSSSSFVVAFPRKPEDKADLQDMMFPKGSPPISIPASLTLDWIVDSVWSDIAAQLDLMSYSGLIPEKYLFAAKHGASHYDLMDTLRGECDAGIIALTEEELDKIEDFLIDMSRNSEEHGVAKDLLTKYPGCVTYRFHYSDEDGPPWGYMESGAIFQNLEGECISHH